MSDIESYAIVTIEGDAFGKKDVRVSRDIPIKKILYNLYDALFLDMLELKNGVSLKAINKGVILSQNDTLRRYDIYDGEILKII